MDSRKPFSPAGTAVLAGLLLGFSAILPAPVGAQPPIYITQWGSYGSGDGQFINPTGVTTDPAGDVYVMDGSNQRVQKFTGTGTYLAKWGSYGSGNGEFMYPLDLATDAAGDVYVVDYDRIQKFTSTGTYLTQWGSPGRGDSQFDFPTGVATDAAGNVYVVDQYNFRIQKFTDTGSYLTQWGAFGTGNGEFNRPAAVATDAAGNLYVSDMENNRIQKFTSTGAYLTQWGSLGTGNGQFKTPYGVATDAAGHVFVADLQNHRIQVFTTTGDYLTQWGSFGSGNGQFNLPTGVATDAGGNIYVVDQFNHRIQKFGALSAPITIGFDFTPNTLDLNSRGLWVTGFLEPTSPLSAGDIDVASIRLNEVVPVDPAAPTALGDNDGNGIPDLMVKFNRAAVELTLPEGDNVAVNVTGYVDHQPFVGTDHIRVRHVTVSAPAMASHLTAGSVTQVRWQTPSGIRAESAALLQSFDDGTTWSLIVRGQPNTGSYDWMVPNVQTDRGKLAVVLAESSDESGNLVDGVLGVSEAFSIDGLVGVGDGGRQFALRGVAPNPAQHELRVSFSLRNSSAATLALFDISGRQLEARRVEGMGPGWHTVALGARSNLSAGLYIIRLSQAGRSLATRAAVIR